LIGVGLWPQLDVFWRFGNFEIRAVCHNDAAEEPACAEIAVDLEKAELSSRTFCNFVREFSSSRSRHERLRIAAPRARTLRYPLYSVTAHAAGPQAFPPDTRARGVSGRRSVIMRPRRWMGTSRKPPIGWPQCGRDVRRPRVPSGLLEPARRCRRYDEAAGVLREVVAFAPQCRDCFFGSLNDRPTVSAAHPCG
jgi:hypothetical protein